ncbi:MAG: hypothetical protein ACREMW_01380 [Gemmatimonadales bacterium]
MRFFLYTYAVPENWAITRRAGVFGTKKDRTGLPSKVRHLRRDDLILIRDGTKEQLQFFGCCRVCGDVFDHDKYSPFRDFLWQEEITHQRVIYPLRVPVDTKDVPKLSLEAISWVSLDTLGFRNTKGLPIQGPRAWAKKLIGNFVERSDEVEAFSRLVGLSAA